MNCPARAPKGRQEGDEPVKSRGIWPVSLGEISDKDARELLREHDRVIWFVLQRHFHRYLANRPAPGADAPLNQDDLYQVGCTALLRAWVTWEPARGAWSTHAVICIKRAITRVLGLERNVPVGRFITTDPFVIADPCSSQDREAPQPSGLEDGVAALSEEADPLEQLEHDNRMRWVRAQLEEPNLLTERQRAVVQAVLVCATHEEAAERLGITRQGIEIQLASALTKLRERAVLTQAWEHAQSTICP